MLTDDTHNVFSSTVRTSTMTSAADDYPPKVRRVRRRRSLRDIRHQALNGAAVQVGANLPATSIVIAQFVLLKNNKKTFYLKNEGENGAIRWQISISIKVEELISTLV